MSEATCPQHRTGLKVTVTERHDGLECSHPGCTYQPGHLGAHSNEEQDFASAMGHPGGHYG